MPLRVVARKDRQGALTIIGTIKGQPVRRRAQSDNLKLAREEAAMLEAEILGTAWHGERRGARSFAEAVLSYLAAEPRAAGTNNRLNRIMRALGDVTLAEVDQSAIERVRSKMLAPDASPATIRRGVITPIRAVLMHAARQKWCDRPLFTIPKQPKGRTRYLLPLETESLIAKAAPHLRPLIIFLVCTGARLSEAIELDWRDVDLNGARAIFWETKGGERRNAHMQPRAVAALAGIPYRAGPVFRWQKRLNKKRPDAPRPYFIYADRDRQGGGQISSGWGVARKASGIDPALTPHDLRHSWASWHYAIHKDLLLLKQEGGWSSVALVERYAHLLPTGHEAEIRDFLNLGVTSTITETASA